MHGSQLVGGSVRDKPDRAASLTERQIECVRLAGQGKTDWEIGVILGISEETAKRHIAEARRHYDVTKRVQVVIRALADGLVSIGDLAGPQFHMQPRST